MDHLKNKLIAVLLVLCTGCKAKTAEEVQMPEEESVTEEAEIVEEIEEITVASRTDEIIAELAMQDLSELLQCDPNAAAYQQAFDSTLTIIEQTLSDTAYTSVSVLECMDHNYMLDLQFDESYGLVRAQLINWDFSEILTTTSDYYEEEILVGKTPQLTGVLTVPKNTEDAPIAVLMVDDLRAGQDGFRTELAHGLAERGIASVRYHYRASQLPQIMNTSLQTMFFEDFAYCVHHLEKYPVNARKIIYIGLGYSGTLGYKAVNEHFEITGGLVLLNSPFTKTGSELMARAYGIELPEDIETDSRGFTVDYWNEWEGAGALNYTRHVAIPILILQGQEDETLSVEEDYDQWKTQKGSNVTMKSYLELGHELRDEEGLISEEVLDDIRSWYDGKNINQKKTTSSTKKN